MDARKDDNPHCVQFFANTSIPESEDCLLLNIYTPKNSDADTSQYPVVVVVHGGSLLVGGNSDFLRDGYIRNLVSRGIVVVTLQYRLGPLG